MRNLKEVLKNYGINGEVIGQTRGALLEIIEFQPAAGTKLKNITAVIDDVRRQTAQKTMR